MRRHVSLFVILLSCASTLMAQDTIGIGGGTRSSPKSWFRLGIGATSKYTFIGGGLFFRMKGPLALGLRGGVALEHELLVQPSEAFWEITPSLAYTPLSGSRGMVSIALGAGMVGGTKRGAYLTRQVLIVDEYEKVKFQAICAALEVQGAIFMTEGLGLNVAAFTNLNGERSFTGYHIGLQFTQP